MDTRALCLARKSFIIVFFHVHCIKFFSPPSPIRINVVYSLRVMQSSYLLEKRKKDACAAPNRKRVSFIFLRFPGVIGKRGKRKLVYRGRGFRLSALLPAFHGGIPRARLGAPFFVGGRDLLFTAVQGMRHNFLGRKSAFERGRRQERAGRLELSSP